MIKLGKVFKIRSSKRVYQREQSFDGVPFLRVSNLIDKITDGLNTYDLFISEKLYTSFEGDGFVPRAGDILVTSRGTLGLCYIVQDTDKFYFQDGMISWLEKREKNVDSIYIAYLFQTEIIKQQIEKQSTGSTVAYISLANLENFDVFLPPLSLQNRFAEFVQQADKSKFVILRSLTMQFFRRII